MTAHRVLLHACCGPCTTAVLEALRADGREVTAFFYNPNLHPAAEYERRRAAMARVSAAMCLEVLWQHPQQGAQEYIRAVRGREGERCRACYQLRLEAAARQAAAGGFDAFTTTLAISPYQDLDLLGQVGQEAASRHHTHFLFQDFRPLYRRSRELAAQLALYRQDYCGCRFSLQERAARLAARQARKETRLVGRNSPSMLHRSASRPAQPTGSVIPTGAAGVCVARSGGVSALQQPSDHRAAILQRSLPSPPSHAASETA